MIKILQFPKIKLNLFPHIARIFPASFFVQLAKYTTFVVLLAFMLLNVFSNQIFGFSLAKKIKLELLKNPLSVEPHEKLASHYLETNQNKAKEEFMLAQDLAKTAKNQEIKRSLLGIQSANNKWSEIESQKQTLEKEIEKWKLVKYIFPDYQFALLKLATINYQLGNRDEAKKYLSDILQTDPTHTTALNLMEKLKSK